MLSWLFGLWVDGWVWSVHHSEDCCYPLFVCFGPLQGNFDDSSNKLNILFFQDVPLSPYLMRTIAQLVMEAGYLDKLDSICEY